MVAQVHCFSLPFLLSHPKPNMLFLCGHEQVVALFVTSEVAFLFSASEEDDEEQVVFVEGFEVLS